MLSREGTKTMALLAGLLFLMLINPGVNAQTNEEINAGLQFNFAPPGARSLALGGAFAGLADDATAAFANPAGLIWLIESEVSVEGRYRNYVTQYPYSGSASSSPTGNGIDTIDNLALREFESDVAGLSFISYAHVPSEKWRLAFYRHELASFEAELESEGPFIRNGGTGSVLSQARLRSRLSAIRGNLDLEIVNYGASVAYSATKSLWLGAGFSYYTFDYDSLSRRYSTNGPPLPSGASATSFDPADFSDANETGRSLQTGDDDDFAVTAGLIWKAKSGGWGIGLVYRQAPTFDLDYQFQWGAQRIAQRDQTGNENFVDPGVVRALSGRTKFEVPDVFSFGWMLKPTQALTVSFEYAHVRYSSLSPEANLISTALRGIRSDGTTLSVDTCGDYNLNGDRYPHGGETRSEVPCFSPYLRNFKVEDADELHLGLEYVIARKSPVALRLGLWHDPDHQLSYDFEGRVPEEVEGPEDRFAFRFPEGEDELHVTGGVGFVANRLQFDLAFDLSERADIFSVSTVYRF
ncbi:MAG: hypothetical protein GY719_06305 [bacterium]|nr:hypothetical protein [bacterium]